MTTLYYTNEFDSYLAQQRILSKFLNIDLKTEKVDKKNMSMILSTSEGLLTDPNSISFYLAFNSQLLNCDSVEVYSWFEFFNI